MTLPGSIGEFGITAGHTPIVAELKSGLIQLYSNVGDSESTEKYFVSGGFAMINDKSEANVHVVECVKLDQLDADFAKKSVASSRAAVEAAAPDSVERAKAQITLEVYESMCSALGVVA